MKTKNTKKPATTLKVERPIGVFDTITANGFRVESGGYLILVNGMNDVATYAPGTWVRAFRP